jgi:DNA end-binding protein Ku
MSARPIGTAAISFGLVSVPVKIFPTADNSQKVSFNWINPTSGVRVRQKYWDPKQEQLVDRGDLVKGYEFAKDQYVLFTPEELKVLEAQSDKRIDISEFIPFAEVERMYLDKAYFLGPDKGGERAYKLLSAALTRTGRAALGRYAARGKQYLVLVRPIGDGLMLEHLYLASELRTFDEVPLGDEAVDEAELDLAVQIVNQKLADSFDPEKYTDEVTGRIMALIEKKIEGQEITAAPEPEADGKVIDLMDALRASIAAEESGDRGAKPARKPARRTAPKKKTNAKKKAAGS